MRIITLSVALLEKVPQHTLLKLTGRIHKEVRPA